MEVEQNNEITKVSIKKLKELREVINELEVCEQAEILKIIERNKIKYTENKNGVFINMNKLTNNAISDIESFIEFVNNNYKKNLI